MLPMKTITARLDDEAEAALAELVSAEGSDQSKVLRRLILDAQRDQILARFREESAALARDPEYRAEIAEINAIMEPLSAR